LKQQTDAALIIPLILDCIQVGVVAINHQGIVIFCNAEAKKMMGFKGEVIGRPIDTVLLNTGLTDVIKSGQAKYGEDYYLGKKRFKNNLSPIMNDGIAVGAVATFSYFTESVDISTELESFMKINQELEGIISSSYDGIIITDGDGIVLKVNDANQRATNLNAEDFLGRKIDSLYENGLFSNEPIAKQARMKKEIVTGLNRINTGKEVMVTSTPVLDEAGNVIRVVTNVRDMSDIISLQ